MRKYLKEAAEQLDAGIFSGDVLYCPEELNELAIYVDRWQRAIAKQREIEDINHAENG